MSQRDKIMKRLDRIPAMPAAAIRVVHLLGDPEVSIAKLIAAIEYDPGLTVNLLRIANSPYFGSPRSVRTLRDAITHLGTNNTYKMVVASIVSSMMRGPVRGYDLAPGQLWVHSIAVALATDATASILHVSPPTGIFTAALLHDVGKIAMGTFLEIDSAPTREAVQHEHISFDAAERRILGTDHAEVGGALLERWNLPSDISQTVRWHHEPERSPTEVATAVELVHLADALMMMEGIGTGSDELNYRPSEAIVRKYRLKTRTAESIIARTMAALDGMHSELNVQLAGGESHVPECSHRR